MYFPLIIIEQDYKNVCIFILAALSIFNHINFLQEKTVTLRNETG